MLLFLPFSYRGCERQMQRAFGFSAKGEYINALNVMQEELGAIIIVDKMWEG